MGHMYMQVIMHNALNYSTVAFITNICRTNLDVTLCFTVKYWLVLLSLAFYI
jgi:hypothetical protein